MVASLSAEDPWSGETDSLLGHLYLYTDTSVKRTEFLESFDLFCNVEFLREAVLVDSVDEVFVFGAKMFHLDTLRDLFPNSKISIKRRKNIIPQFVFVLLRNLLFFAKYCFVALIGGFLCKSECKHLGAKRLFFTTFPSRLSPSEQEQKFCDLVRKEDWFLASVLTDGKHQNLSLPGLVNAFRNTRKLKRTIVIDRHHKISDAVFGFFLPVD